jgi:hypothetical protein
MKRTWHSLAVLVAAAALPLASLDAQSFTFHVGGGGAKGTQDLDNGTDTGWIGFAGADYLIGSVPGLSVGVTGSYTHIPWSGVDAATNIPAAFAELGYLIGATSASPIKPYLRGGVGVLQHRFEADGYGGDTESETRFGGAVGAGLNWMMGSVTPFVGIHYVTSGSSTSFATAYIGLGFGGGSRNGPVAIRR